MQKVTYKISGMHCKSCEILIEDKLQGIDNIEKINVNCQTGLAEVYYKDIKPNYAEVKKALKSMGYEIEELEKKEIEKFNNKIEIISKDKKNYYELLIAGIIFITLYMLFGILKLDKIFTVDMSSSTVSWSTAILIGLTAGVSTCMALVGGLIMGVSTKFSEKHPNLSAKQKFIPHVFFNVGRIVGFFLLGGILGLVGSAFKMSISLTGLLTIGVGIFMLLLGAQLLNIFPFISNFKLTLPKGISRFFGITDEKNYSHKGTMLLGALTFFLPCGFTQAMQLYAVSSGNFISGGLIMALFAIGTAPGLLGIGGLTSFIKGKFSGIFFKVAGLAVIIFSLFNLNNGHNLILSGTSGSNNANNNSSVCPLDSTSSACNLDGGVVGDDKTVDSIDIQVIKANFDVTNDISPTTFRVNVGKPVRFEINASENGSGCMSTIMIPGVYNKVTPIRKGLVSFTFTPTKAGSYPITCAMGVNRGTLIVQ